MIGLKKVILTFCVYLIGVGGMGNVWASNKTIRDFHEFELWHKLLQYGLSPSGEWAMWRIQAAEKTDTLFVRHIASGKEYKYKNTFPKIPTGSFFRNRREKMQLPVLPIR